MIQTIVEFSQGQYPYHNLEDHINLKLQTLIECDSSSKFVEEKKKYQLLKNINSPYIVNLTQIYQEGLIIHLIYECCHTSLSTYLINTIQQCKNQDRQKVKKQLLNSISFELVKLSQFLTNNMLVTHFSYNNFGAVYDNFIKEKASLKYFIGSNFQFTEHSKEQLNKFYLLQRKKILCQVEEIVKLEKRADHLPNFILRGNKLIFTDQLSETKTKRKRSESPTKQRFDNSEQQETTNRKQRQKQKYGRTNTKPKKHKYSCNFEQQNLNYEFENQKLNRSVEQENQNYQITQTKSIKLQMQHIKPNKKNRKNSIKFKITTFEQISIDQSLDEQQFEVNKRTSTSGNGDENCRNGVGGGDRKNYKQKVHEAKVKAEALLTKYNKARNKSSK